ncbi:MAG: peptidoglycan editing factor PgeF [Pseudomonadota bacterium]
MEPDQQALARPNPIQASSLAELSGIRHGFFTREGGLSTGDYRGLNVGLGSKDDRATVLENRRRVATWLGHEAAPVNTLHQVHSAAAVLIDRPFEGPPPEADALVTATPGVNIGARAADCTPILFAEPNARIVAATHSGWRGAIGGVLEATVAKMQEAGADPTRIRAAIGPTINQPSYEVGPEFEAQFVARDPDYARYFAVPDGRRRAHFDLPQFVEDRLRATGLRHIERQTACTYENEPLFYSYRRATHRGEPDYGRQISAIVVT